jgi:hypothetical protein
VTFKTILKSAEKFMVDNSPGILTGLGVAGTVTTALLTYRSAFRVGMDASTQFHEALANGEPPEVTDELMTTKHLVNTYWREFLPAAIALSASVTSIIMANQIGSRRAAAITAAFKLSEKIADEYREKVQETLGAKAEEKVRTAITEKKIENTPGSDTIIVTGSETIFFDEWSGRYFKSDMESVRKAVNDINYRVNNDFYASLSDFYNLLGLEPTEVSEEVGWNADQQLEVSFNAVLMKDNRPAIGISYNKTPIRGYDRIN